MQKLYISNKDESARMFQSDLAEIFTRVHPLVPHLIFLPVIGYMMYRSTSIALEEVVVLFIFGWWIWSLLEYTLHRFAFHFKPRNSWERKLYFIIHGVHHDYPNDSRRLVMPPIISIPLALIFYGVFALILGSYYVSPFFAGLVTGYVVYDTTHYAIHHFRLRGKLGLYLRQRHLRHHYVEPDYNFGISSPLWDIVFGTLRKRSRAR